MACLRESVAHSDLFVYRCIVSISMQYVVNFTSMQYMLISVDTGTDNYSRIEHIDT